MLKTFLRIILLIFIFSESINAQVFTVKGRVTDSITFEPMPFVNIRINKGTEGGVTDIDGYFNITSKENITKLTFSFVGYTTIEYSTFQNPKNIKVRMSKKTTDLSSVVITPKESPANKIIQKVLDNRNINDYEKLDKFQYVSYDKMIFMPETDTIPLIDSLVNDTTFENFRQKINRQYLFIMESVNKRSFKAPDNNFNEVLATKVSGLKDPLFIFLIQSLQSTSFYKDKISILSKSYINPLSTGTFKRYYFEINDTIVDPYPYDTTFVISYRPFLKSSFNGLKGLLYISSNGFAVRNVIASPSESDVQFEIKIQQLYDLKDSTIWFPKQLNTEILFNPISISIEDSAKKSRLFKIKGVGKSYIDEVNLNPDFKKNTFGIVETQVSGSASKLNDSIWNSYRYTPLSQRELNTYKIIDSIGEKHNFDRYLKIISAIIEGKVNLGYLNLHLYDLINYNEVEGVRTGLHLSTSDKLSTWFSVGGYAAYGFKDKRYKYSYYTNFTLAKNLQTVLGFKYTDDVAEAGNQRFGISSSQLNIFQNTRDLFINRMDLIKQYETNFSTRITKDFSLFAIAKTLIKTPNYEYNFINNESDSTFQNINYKFHEATLGLRFANKETLIRMPNKVLPVFKNSPDTKISYTIGKSFYNNQIYSRIDFESNLHKEFGFIGTSKLCIKAGYIDKPLPYVQLYNADAAFNGFFNLNIENSFATMRYNEFVSDKFVSAFYYHKFAKPLINSKKYKPTLGIVFNAGYGSISNPEMHEKIDVKDYSKGYYEAGIRFEKVFVNSIFSYGFGVNYRLGYYSFPKFRDNISINLLVNFAD